MSGPLCPLVLSEAHMRREIFRYYLWWEQKMLSRDEISGDTDAEYCRHR